MKPAMNPDEERNYEKQVKIFDQLVDKVDARLRRFGEADSLLKSGDYAVYGDYWGYPQVKVSVSNLELLSPSIVKQLQDVVTSFPNWEIVVAVAVPGHYEDWPDMGLYIRANEIIDGLQRDYFPERFRNFHYEGSRRGT